MWFTTRVILLYLLRKYKTTFIEDNVAGYGTSGTLKSFQSKTLYFVIDQNGVAKDIKLNEKINSGNFS